MLTKSLFCRNYANVHFFLQKAPIHYAAENGHTEIVEILTKKKAVLNAKDFWQVRNFWKSEGQLALKKN